MWVKHSKLVEMESRLSCLEHFAKECAVKEGFYETSGYADNEMCWKEIRICVSGHDLCLLQKEPFYRELVQFGKELNKRIQGSMQSPDEQTD